MMTLERRKKLVTTETKSTSKTVRACVPRFVLGVSEVADYPPPGVRLKNREDIHYARSQISDIGRASINILFGIQIRRMRRFPIHLVEVSFGYCEYHHFFSVPFQVAVVLFG
jgi:hypothetical protein